MAELPALGLTGAWEPWAENQLLPLVVAWVIPCENTHSGERLQDYGKIIAPTVDYSGNPHGGP